MSLARLLDIIHSETQDSWYDSNDKAFEALFGSPEGRYPKAAAKAVTLRAPEMSADTGVPLQPISIPQIQSRESIAASRLWPFPCRMDRASSAWLSAPKG